MSTMKDVQLLEYIDVFTFTREHKCLNNYKSTLMYVHLQENTDVNTCTRVH